MAKDLQRRTCQRALLLELIRKAEGHPDANELYRQARERQPGLSLSTVYRSLRLFKELDLVEEHQLDGARRHYEARPATRQHLLVCLSCGRVIEVKCPSTERLKTRVAREEGFEVTEAEVHLVGYCPQCRQRILGSKVDAERRQEIAEGRCNDAQRIWSWTSQGERSGNRKGLRQNGRDAPWGWAQWELRLPQLRGEGSPPGRVSML